jgi:hypothetical protein
MKKENTRIYISSTPSDFQRIKPVLKQLETKDWKVFCGEKSAQMLSLPVGDIDDCDVTLSFISAAYINDKDTFVTELCYAACALHKPFILIAQEDMGDLPADMEMLAARDGFVAPHEAESALERWLNTPVRQLPGITSERRHAIKPFGACAENSIFISYAHDDALAVYPIIKNLYEEGWNLWYDEGIRITERYISEIALHIRDCELFLLFVTARSVERDFIMNFEVAYAKKLKKKVVLFTEGYAGSLPVELLELENISSYAALQQVLTDSNIPNHGNRAAVPPITKIGVEYDIDEPPALPDYQYKIDGKNIIISKYTGSDCNVKIPGSHAGYDVTGIGTAAFYSNETIRSVTIPEGVTHISEMAFESCRDLLHINIPDSVISIENNAFQGTGWDKNNKFSSGYDQPVLYAGKVAYGVCGIQSLDHISREEIRLLPGTVGIADEAFAHSWDLWEIDIPDSVVNIGREAFRDCLALPKINIPESVIHIGANAFKGCRALTIYCTEDSTAHRHAVDNKIPFTLIQNDASAGTDVGRQSASVGPEDNYAYFCRANTDAAVLEPLIQMLYDMGCNFLDESSGQTDKQLIENARVLVIFFSERSALIQEKIISVLQCAVDADIPVLSIFIDDMTLPAPWNKIILDRQGILRSACGSDDEFQLQIIGALQGLECYSGAARNFLVAVENGGVTITGYTGNSSVVRIPPLFFTSLLPVTKIGRGAFEDSLLTEIVIPDSVTEIEWAAFHNCKTLSRINLPKNLMSLGSTTFGGCEKLTQIVLPDSLNKIENYTFCGCDSLAEIILPEGIDEIGKEAFKDCVSLTAISFPERLRTIGDNAFQNCGKLQTITIPDNVDNIGVHTFCGCASMISVILGEGLISTGNASFMNCFRLTDIHLPESIKHIGYNAFDHCLALKTIVLPKNLHSIDISAFDNCRSLENIIIQEGMTKIERSFFDSIKNLKTITIPISVTDINDCAFDNYNRLVFYCEKGSYAWQYAKYNRIKVKKLRDSP